MAEFRMAVGGLLAEYAPKLQPLLNEGKWEAGRRVSNTFNALADKGDELIGSKESPSHPSNNPPNETSNGSDSKGNDNAKNDMSHDNTSFKDIDNYNKKIT
jgi:hypothetical protein